MSDYLNARVASANRAITAAIKAGNHELAAARQRDLESLQGDLEDAVAREHRQKQRNHRKRIND